MTDTVTLSSLAASPRWLAWNTELRNGRVTKVPRSPRHGREGASTRPEDWGTRPEAEAAAARLPPPEHGPKGAGIVLGDWCGVALGGVDLDACRDPATGALAPWAGEVLRLLETYAEVSPSGTGTKAFFRMQPGAVEALRAEGLLGPGGFGRSFKRPGAGDHPPAIEVHLGGRYYTVTGERLPEAPEVLRLVPTETLAILLRDIAPRFRGAAPPAAGPFGIPAAPAGGDGSRSARAFALAAAVKAAGGDFEGFLGACEADPAAGAWLREKGMAHGAREARRAWERASGEPGAAAEPAAWPEPDMSLAAAEALPPPAWPADLFPGRWRAFIADAAEARGCPADYVGLAVLAAVASRLGNARWGSPWPGWAEPTALWVAAVGAPSSGKSGGMDEAAEALAALEAGANQDWSERQAEHRTARKEAEERRARWEADVKAAVKAGNAPPREPLAAREPQAPARRRAVTSDPTVEKAGLLAAENPRGLLLLRDELAGWLGGMGRYSGAAAADRGFWLAAHGGRRWVADRVKDNADGNAVEHLTYSIAGTIQPDRVASLLMAGDDDGLAARFIFAWPTPTRPTRPTRPPPTGRLAEALQRLESLAWEPPARRLLPFTEPAADALQEWRGEAAEMGAEAAGLYASWSGKLPGFAVRLAVVFEHLEWLAEPPGSPPPEAVGIDATARAIGFLCEYAAPMARRVFGEADLPESERDARRLARWLLRQPAPRPEVLNAKALRRMADGPSTPTPERMDAALSDLAAAGWLRPAPGRAGETPGRTRKDWTLHPAIRAGGP